MLLEDIYKREGLEVDEERVTASVQELLRQAAEENQEVEADEVGAHFREQAKNMSALAFLAEHAKVSVVPMADE